MEVTLRKAAALSESLLLAARAVQLPMSVDVSIYSGTEVAGLLTDGRQKMLSAAEESEQLTNAAYGIRASIGAANSKRGIDALLTEKAGLDATEKVFTMLKSAPLARDAEEISAELAMARTMVAAATTRTYRSDSITVGFNDEETSKLIKTKLAAIRRRKVAIADELLAVNMTAKVVIPESTVELLKSNQLI
jgi:hypothetical protein